MAFFYGYQPTPAFVGPFPGQQFGPYSGQIIGPFPGQVIVNPNGFQSCDFPTNAARYTTTNSSSPRIERTTTYSVTSTGIPIKHTIENHYNTGKSGSATFVKTLYN